MISVACPSCAAAYDVDEARLPSKGLKMRCPKCSHTFWVGAGGVIANPDGEPAPLPKKATSLPPLPPKPKRAKAKTAVFGQIDLPKPAARAPLPSPVAKKKVAPPPIATRVDVVAPEHQVDNLPRPVSKKPAKSKQTMAFSATPELPLPASPDQPFPGKPVTAKTNVKSVREETASFDLPAPVASPIASVDLKQRPATLDDLDLPAPASLAPALDLPTPAATLDLPTPAASIELPTPAALELDGSEQTPFDGFDLDDAGLGSAPLADDGTGPELGLGEPGLDSGDAGFADAGLSLDLPTPSADLPTPSAALPTPSAALPTPSAALPTPAAELPTPGDAGNPFDFGDDLGLMDGPEAATADVGLDLDGGAGDFGEVDLGLSVGGDADDLMAPDLAAPDLDDDDGADGFDDFDFGTADMSDEAGDLEFADLPDAADIDEAARPANEDVALPKSGSKLGLLVAFAVVLALLGAALYALKLTPYGTFGIYVWEQYLPEAGDEASVNKTITDAEAAMASDTYLDTRSGLKTLASARQSMGLNRRLLVRSAMHEALFVHRFGSHVKAEGRLVRLMKRLEVRSFDAPGVEIARAAHALWKGEYASATNHLKSVPDADAYKAIVAGEIALAQRKHPEALAAYQSSDLPAALWGSIQASPDADKPALLDALEKASPKHAGARLVRAKLALAAEDFDGAIKAASAVAYRNTEDIVTNAAMRAEGYSTLAATASVQGRLMDAANFYQSAIELQPTSLSALLGRGETLSKVGQYAAALAVFESASDLTSAGDANWVDAELGIGQSLIALGRPSEAQRRFDKPVFKTSTDPRVHVIAGDIAEERGDTEGSEKAYQAAIDAAPKQIDGYHAMLKFLLRHERSKDIPPYMKAAQKEVEGIEKFLVLGEIDMERGRFDKAIKYYDAALTERTAFAPALFGKGVALRRANKLDEAATTFDAVEAIDRAYPRLSLERGRLLEERGDVEGAITAYKGAVEANPADPELKLRLGAALVVAGQFTDANKMLDLYRKANPDSPEALHYAGRAQFGLGQVTLARELLAESVRSDPANARFRASYGRVLLASGRAGDAKNEVAEALKLDSDLPEALLIRGEILERQGRVSDAIDDFDAVIEAAPNLIEAKVGKARALEQTGKRKDAIALLKAATVARPSQGAWWHLLSKFQMDEGDRAASLQAAAKAIASGEALAERPYWYADSHRLKAEAHRLAKENNAALTHYEAFLEAAPENAPERPAVERRVKKLRE